VSERTRVLAQVFALGYNFNRLWVASAFSNLGDGLLRVALPLFVVQITDSPAAVAGLTVAANAAWLTFGLPAGALNDRLDRRRVMKWASLARSAITIGLVLAAILDLVSLPVLYLFAFAVGVGEAFSDTAGPALVPAVVRRSQLQQANARRYGAALVTNEFIGPSVGGAMFALSRWLPFTIAAVAFTAAGGLISLLRGEFRASRPASNDSLFRDVSSGVRYLLGESTVRVLAFWSFAGNMAGAITFSVLVLYAVDPGPIGLTEARYGLVLAGLGVGGLLGTLLVGGLSRLISERNILAMMCVLMAAESATLVLTTRVPLIVLALITGAAAAAIFSVTSTSLFQQLVPDELLSRVSAGFRIILLMGIPIGALIAGTLGEVTGDLRWGFGLAAVLFIALAGLRSFLKSDG
jgi:MFS family permease